MKQKKNEFLFYPEVVEGQRRSVVAGVYDEDSNMLTVAKSECSEKDNFCKDKGRKIALGRAKCERDIKIKHYVGGTSNSHLLPLSYKLNPNESPLKQFIEIAKQR